MIANKSHIPDGTWVKAKRNGIKRYITRQTNSLCFEDDGVVSGQKPSPFCHYNDYTPVVETVKTEVVSCGNCPFMVSHYDGWSTGDDTCDTCNLTGNILGSYMGFEEPGYSTPEDCPLKKEDYLITFKR